jgi:acid phosphatase class B
MKTISFDFDDSICMQDGTPNLEMINIIKKYHENNYNCVIVTARNLENEKNPPSKERVIIQEFVKNFNLPISRYYFTNHELKGPLLKEIKASIHYDDDEEQLRSAEEHGVEAIKPPTKSKAE